MDYKEFMNGIIGGWFGAIISHPIDTTRILKQTNKPIIIKHLYRGIIPPLIGIGLEKSIVFGTFYNLNNNIYTKEYSSFYKGIISGLLSTVIVSPIEKIKIQLQTNKYDSIYKSLTSEYKNTIGFHNKIKLFYKGWLATLFREVPGYGFYFMAYENLKHKNDNLFESFYKGAFSGAFAWSIIYPSDHIKTLVQESGNHYKETIGNIIKKGNIFLFYRGFSFALIRCIPLHGGVFAGYEFMNNMNKNIL